MVELVTSILIWVYRPSVGLLFLVYLCLPYANVFQRGSQEAQYRLVALKALNVVACGYGFYLISVASPTRPLAVAAATLLAFASQLLFWSAFATTRRQRLSLIFSHDIPSHVETNGPYRFIRNPFYTSYIFGYSSVAIYACDVVYLLVVIGLFFLYFLAAKQEEAKFMQSELREKYARYRSTTGMFMPRILSRIFQDR